MEVIAIQGRAYPVTEYIHTPLFKKPIPVLGIRMMEDKRKGGRVCEPGIP